MQVGRCLWMKVLVLTVKCMGHDVWHASCEGLLPCREQKDALKAQAMGDGAAAGSRADVLSAEAESDSDSESEGDGNNSPRDDSMGG